MNKFIVLHMSNNWMMDGMATMWFNTRAEAENYVSNFQGTFRYHKTDKYWIAEILETGEAVEIDKDLAGFKR